MANKPVRKKSTNVRKKLYVLDTNVLLVDPNALYSFGNSEVVLPLVVLEELDKVKSHDNGVGFTARRAVREILRLLHGSNKKDSDGKPKRGNPRRGIALGEGGIFRVKLQPESTKLPAHLDKKKNDNKIIDCVLSLMVSNKNKDVILVTGDSNMTAVALVLGVTVEEYIPNLNGYGEKSKMYKGVRTLVVEDNLIENVQNDKKVPLPSKKGDTVPVKNEFLILRSSSDNKKTAMVRYIDEGQPLRKIYTAKEVSFSGIIPRNKEQRLYLDILTDQNIDLVTATGLAGSGKTLMALAAGLHQVLEDTNKPYSRLVVTRPVQPFGKDIGFLPGDKNEKMDEWLAPIWDNLYEILGSSKKNRSIKGHQSVKAMMQELVEQGIIEVEALTYIKGRSISNAFIIVDEAEDLTEDNLKRIITRVGHNSKLVLTADISQIDNSNISPFDSGFVNVVRKMMNNSNVAHITLARGERSPIASLAAETL